MKKIKTLTGCLAFLLLAVPAMAFDASSITFSITSSAVTATPNLRLGIMKGPLGKDGNEAIQGLPIPRPVNYYLTKSETYSFATGTKAIQIQVDQDTKLYVGSDLTNYLLLPAKSDYTYIVR